MDDYIKPKNQLIEELQELREQVEILTAYKFEHKGIEKELQETLHDLKVHQEELRAQNEDLRIAQHEAQSSQKKYFRLFDFAPSGYFTLDHDQGCSVLGATHF